MITIQSDAGAFGPFNDAEVVGDRVRAGGIEFPISVLGTYQIVNGAPPAPSTANPILIRHLIAQIDTDTDAIYAAAIGNRGPEYDQAAADAAAYRTAGYTGDVPPSVQSWATAKGWTAQQAADDIMTAAARLGSARDAIRANRLLRKEQVRNATTNDQLDMIAAEWGAFVSGIRAQLGV